MNPLLTRYGGGSSSNKPLSNFNSLTDDLNNGSTDAQINKNNTVYGDTIYSGNNKINPLIKQYQPQQKLTNFLPNLNKPMNDWNASANNKPIIQPIQPIQRPNFLQSIGNGFMSGLNSADKAIMQIPGGIAKLDSNIMSLLPKSIYNKADDNVLKATQNAVGHYGNLATTYNNANANATGFNKLAGNVAGFIPQGLEMGAELALPMGRFGKLGELISKGTTPIAEAGGNLLGKGLLSKVATSGLKSGLEMGTYGGMRSALTGGNLNDMKNEAVGFGVGGLAFGAGFGAVGQALPLIGKGIGYLGNRFNKPLENAIKPIETPPIINPNELLKTSEVNTPLKANNILGEGLQSNKIGNNKFIENSVQNSEVAPQIMKDTIGQPTHERISNKATWDIAQNRVETDVKSSLNEFISKSEVSSAGDTALGEALINKAVQEGRIEDANSLSVNLAEKLVRAGQTVQAASIFKRLTPTGMLNYANKVIQGANEKLSPNKQIVISTDVATKLVEDMKKITLMPEGTPKIEATQVVLKTIANQIPSGILKKVDTLQTMAQLLNPKTSIRNIIGNAGMQLNENISNTIGTPIDMALSKLTGNRTVTFPNLKTQVLGDIQGLKNGIRQTKLGITGDSTQFDLPNSKVFSDTNIFGRKANAGQKVLDYMLRVPDEAAKEGIRADSLKGQMKLAKVDVPTEEMKITAENDAKYGTFQDDTKLAHAFSAIKKALNLNKEFGLGSLLLKYPKTPANIIMRAIDYSPAGFFKSAYRLAEPLLTGKEFNQRDFVKSTSRALVGTGNLIGSGYILGSLGIITGKSSSDYDTSNMQKQVGLGDYKFNIDGLKRFVISGFDTAQAKPQKGDHLINYDWFQPSSIGLAIGANAADKTKKSTDILTTATDAINSGMDTLAQQPLISGLTSFFGKSQYGIGKALFSTLQGVPSSMTPTILKQIAQLSDNTTRNSYSPTWMGKAENMVKAKTPGLTSTLQPSIDSLGNDRKAFQNNSLGNVFLNPAFNTTYNPTGAAQLPTDIYNNTGNTTSMPRQTPNYIMSGGKRLPLTAQENADFQRNVGQQTSKAITQLSGSPADDNTAKVIQNLMTAIQASERDKILENRGISTVKVKETSQEKAQQNLNSKTKKNILNNLGIK